jgi:hypothetical protein
LALKRGSWEKLKTIQISRTKVSAQIVGILNKKFECTKMLDRKYEKGEKTALAQIRAITVKKNDAEKCSKNFSK